MDWSKQYSVPLEPASVAIQGQEGSFSHIASRDVFGRDEFALKSFDTFDGPFKSVQSGESDMAVIPIQNTIAGPVPYVPSLIWSYCRDDDASLYIVGEYFLKVEHCLVTLPDVQIGEITHVHSHSHAIAQCGNFLEDMSIRNPKLKVELNADTAGSAKLVAQLQDRTQAAISPAFAAAVYGLEVCKLGIQDDNRNVTRFLMVARKPATYERSPKGHYVTTLVIKPHRSLTGNLARLRAIADILEANNVVCADMQDHEGHLFRNEGVYLELMGHPKDENMQSAMKALRKISSEMDMIGYYPAHHFYRFPNRNPHGLRPAALGNKPV